MQEIHLAEYVSEPVLVFRQRTLNPALPLEHTSLLLYKVSTISIAPVTKGVLTLAVDLPQPCSTIEEVMSVSMTKMAAKLIWRAWGIGASPCIPWPKRWVSHRSQGAQRTQEKFHLASAHQGGLEQLYSATKRSPEPVGRVFVSENGVWDMAKQVLWRFASTPGCALFGEGNFWVHSWTFIP